MAEDEARLLELARTGREAAFLALYQRYRTPVYRFAWRLTGSVESAEDVTQDCFVALLSGAAFDGRQGELRAYLFGIARHLAFRRMRANERESADGDESLEMAGGVDALAGLLHQERAAAVARAISLLPPLQREALILYEYEELSLEEIAQVAAIEVGAVKSRLHRARETLRKRLAPLLDACPERSCL
jgi:RNA polymerase sigma-70 factor (ECF subfamily)